MGFELKRWTPAARMANEQPRGYMVGKKDGRWVYGDDADCAIAMLRDKLAEMEWTPITPKNLPKVGDEVLRYRRGSPISPSVDNAVCPDDTTYGEWLSMGYTHFRKINAPAAHPATKD